MSELAIGFVRLLDAAPVIVAAECGFAEREGLRLRLDREASWATLRDKLALGIVDAAHMLAPLALATSLGLPPLGAPIRLAAPLALSRNGNAVTLSHCLWEEIAGPGTDLDPTGIAVALARHVRERSETGRPPLRLASVFPYSTHTYQLRAFLRLGGLDPDAEVALTVVPPPHMADALAQDAIDGFCSGSPWNSVAVEAGFGRIVAFGSDVAPDAPEKVLAYRPDRIEPEATARLLRAVGSAGRWCADASNRDELAALMAEPRHLDLDRNLIARVLAGDLRRERGGPLRTDARFIRFGPDIGDLTTPDAEWIVARMAEAGQISPSAAMVARARDVFTPQAPG